MPEPTKLHVWTDSDRCSGCRHCGMDMDMDPFCVHPAVMAVHPAGLSISQAVKRFCGDGDTLTLWAKRGEPEALPKSVSIYDHMKRNKEALK